MGSVLVVDDEAGIRLLLQTALSRTGFDVVAVDSAEAALAQLPTRHFDLLLTDKNMPGLDGVELSKRARALYPHLCIVLVTGYANDESARSARGVIDAYFTKPFAIRDLHDKLAALLERRHALTRDGRPDASLPPPGTTPSSVAVHCSSGFDRQQLESAATQAGVALEVTDGPKGIAALRAGALLLVDAPGCTSEVLRAIWRQQAKDPGFGVVLLTSWNDAHPLIDALSLNARSALAVPVSVDALLAAVGRRAATAA